MLLTSNIVAFGDHGGGHYDADDGGDYDDNKNDDVDDDHADNVAHNVDGFSEHDAHDYHKQHSCTEVCKWVDDMQLAASRPCCMPPSSMLSFRKTLNAMHLPNVAIRGGDGIDRQDQHLSNMGMHCSAFWLWG